MALKIKVNGVDHTVNVDGDTPLLWVLRDVLGMTGTKFGCGMALCGACTVQIDGVATRSCITTIDSIGALRQPLAGRDTGNWQLGRDTRGVDAHNSAACLAARGSLAHSA
jgi:xanthine dehydrogenase iron-sulfur cluster and FAD-binding subunit A